MGGNPVRAVVVAAIALMVCGCGGARDSTASPSLICVLAPAPPRMVYPISGATNVPDGNFTLVLTTQTSPVKLVLGTTVVYSNLQPAVVPNPLPSPSATVAPGAQLGGYTVGTLQKGATYDVFAPIPQSGCFPEGAFPSPKPGSIGSFTTT